MCGLVQLVFGWSRGLGGAMSSTGRRAVGGRGKGTWLSVIMMVVVVAVVVVVVVVVVIVVRG